MKAPSALVYQATREHLLTVDLNALAIVNVIITWHALIKNVQIHAWVRVVQILNVEWSVTLPCACVEQVTRAIHLHIAALYQPSNRLKY